ncbi:MAG: hypothetical protein LBN24_03450 [Mediterranea sp.]|jgi:hypothetical protein|nr:hypothetical protein [Mediterranea sp.]
MKKNRILALALSALLALASCDNNLIEQPEQGGGSGNGSGSADQPAYIVNAEGDTLYLVTPMVEMAPTPALTRAEQETKTYDMGHGMTLKVIPEAPKAGTRSVSALKEGTLVQMYVYDDNDNGAYVANSMRQYSIDSNGKPTGGTGGLYLPVGDYTVYCFTDAANTSGATSTPSWTPGYTVTPSTALSSATVTVPQGVDAAWGAGKVRVGMYSPNKVSATLARKCAQISEIDIAPADLAVITSLYITKIGLDKVVTTAQKSGANFGDIAASEEGTETIESLNFPTVNFPAQMLSGYTSYTLTDPVYLLPQSNAFDFTCTAAINDNMNNTKDYSTGIDIAPLKAGFKYVLKINVSTTIFAYSNVFYDSSVGDLNFYVTQDKTFKENSTMVTNSSAKQMQGLYFKAGSLYGISSNLNIYQPNNTEGTAYDAGYTEATSVQLADISEGIQGIAGGTPADNSLLTSYLGDGTSTFYSSKDGNSYGDVCAYITKGKWRLPTAAEFNLDGTAKGKKDTFTSSVGQGSGWLRYGENGAFNQARNHFSADGTDDGVTGGAVMEKNNNPFFPDESAIKADGTLMMNMGGNYWSGTVVPGETGVLSNLSFFYDSSSSSGIIQYAPMVSANNSTSLSGYAVSVRCVLNQ